MRRRSMHRGVTVLFVLALLTACSGGDDDESADTASEAEDDASDASDADEASDDDSSSDDESGGDGSGGDAAADELPAFMSEFDRVCNTQVGFGGAAAYDAGAGIHPVILFEEHDGSLLTTSRTLPAGWAVTEDLDFEDNSELAEVQLVACAAQTSATPNGTDCELEGDDGEVIELELVDTTYELRVFEAATGDPVGEPVELEAAGTECPTFVFVGEDDTTFDNEPEDDEYIVALRPAVEPA